MRYGLHCQMTFGFLSIFITEYLKTKWPVGKDKCALEGKGRHDGLGFSLFCVLLTQSSFSLYRKGFVVLPLCLKIIEIVSKRCCSLPSKRFIANKAILCTPCTFSVGSCETMAMYCLQDQDCS